MINDYEKGGLKMIDVLSYNKALQIVKIKKISRQLQSRKVEKCFFDGKVVFRAI